MAGTSAARTVSPLAGVAMTNTTGTASSSYLTMRSTTFDRAELSARIYGAVLGVVFAPIVGFVAYLAGLRGNWLPVSVVVGGAAVGLSVFRLSIGIARGSGAAFLAFVQPSGKSTPFDRGFSQALALEASDDVQGALAWFDAALIRTPGDPRLRVALGDLCMRQAMHGRAEALYLEARRLTGHPDLELYCTQRVIDLRLGPLARPEQAFPELRRVIDRFPATREAEGARLALSRLKAEIAQQA